MRGESLSFGKYKGSQHKKRDFLKRWTITLYQLLLWGLLCGNLDVAKFRDLARKKSNLFWSKIEPEEDSSRPLAEGKKEEQAKMRNIVKSGLHTSTALLLDSENKLRQRILYVIGEPVTQWFTKMSSTMRSSRETSAYLQSCVVGTSLTDVYQATLANLEDGANLDYWHVVAWDPGY